MASTTTYAEGNTTTYPVWTMYLMWQYMWKHEILACKKRVASLMVFIYRYTFLTQNIHNISSSNWIIQWGHIISKMEVRQIWCYHTNSADASTPSKIWYSHSGDYERCCRFLGCHVVYCSRGPWCLHPQTSTMKMDAADSSETSPLIYQDNDVTSHEHASPKTMLTLNTTHFFYAISNDVPYYRTPYFCRQKHTWM